MQRTMYWLMTLSLIGFIACSDDKDSKTTAGDSGTETAVDAAITNDITSSVDQASTTSDMGVSLDSLISTDSQSSKAEAPFKDLQNYQALKATVTLTPNVGAEVTKVELLIDGKSLEPTLVADKAPFELSLDTTKLTDGLIKISFKSTVGTTTTTSSEMTVVVLNNGLEATFLDGNSATISVPAAGVYKEQHLKYHWTMPENIKGLIGVVSWDTEGFKLELVTGVGECPDANPTGVKKKDESKESPLGIEFHQESEPLTTGRWYLHVAPLNPEEMPGKSTTFNLKAYLLK